MGALIAFTAAPASAAPTMCTEHDANPRGVVATHLFAKLDGTWVEPQNVCVFVRITESLGVGARYVRGMYLGVHNTVDGGFPETHLPPGTRLSLGLRFPPGTLIQSASAGWRNGVMVTEGADTVIQGNTVPWEYHNEAYFGPGLDCGIVPTIWPSTFTAYASLNWLNPDRTPNYDSAEFAGGFYESNSVGVSFPRVVLGPGGVPTGLEVTVQGCGDADPTTHEGYLDGFTPLALFHGFGISDQLLEDAAVLQDIVEIHDRTTGGSIPATFSIVRAGGLALESIPGVQMPSPAPGPILGVRTTSTFSFSKHDLVQRGEPAAMRALRRCRSKGGTPESSAGRLTCVPDRKRPRARLLSGSTLPRGKALRVSCNEPCRVEAAVVAGRGKLAGGSRKRTSAGTVKVPMTLTAKGRQALAMRPSARALLKLIVADRAGNVTRLRRGIRLTR